MRVLNAIRGSFPAKLIALLFGVAVLVGAIGGLIYVQTGETLAEETESKMVHSTELQANTLEAWADRNHDQAVSVATADGVAAGDRERVASVLEEEGGRVAAAVEAIHYVDAETGEVLESTDSAAVGASYAETRWADREQSLPADGESTVTTTYEDPTTGAEAVAFVASVPDANRLIVLPVDLHGIGDLLDRPPAVEGEFTHVVNSDGFVVLDQHATSGDHDGDHGSDINTQNMGPEDETEVVSEGVRRGLDGESGYVEMDMGHAEMAMGYAPVEGTDWVVMTHVPVEDAYALQSDIQWSVLALIVVSVVGLGLVGVVVGRNTTRSLRDLASTAQEIEDGDLDADLETGRTDEIGQLYGAFDSMRASLKETLQDAERAREEAERERERVEAINDQLQRAADEYSATMAAAADGDLTVRSDVDVDHEQMRTIGEEFNEMLAEIERTVAGVERFAAEVAAASEQVTASSEEIRSASERISESTQEIAEGANRQNESLRRVGGEMSELSTTTEQIAASSNEVADLAAETARTGQQGREAAQAAIESMTETESEAQQAVEEMEALEEEMVQVDRLLDQIGEIVEQTNMLALNANIEASRTRSGDDVEGFGAVAQEVRELSDDAKGAAKEIETRLESIREQTRDTSAVVETTSTRLDEASDQVREAVDSLEEIAEFAERTNDGVQEISAASQQQAASTEEVVAMVEEAATISEETASEAESVAAAAEEQTASVAEVTDSATQLSDRASRLSTALDSFEVGVEFSDRGPDRDDAPTDRPDDGASAGTDSEETVVGSAENDASNAEEPDETDWRRD